VAHNQANQGPEQVENKPKIHPNQLIFAEHHQWPTKDAQRSSLTKMGTFGLSGGVATPLVQSHPNRPLSAPFLAAGFPLTL